MKICLIGSSRFVEEYRAVNRRLTLSGHVVYTIAAISSSASESVKAEEVITEDDKTTLDLAHFLKMQASEAVLIVTDNTGYIGFSTKREIKWAMMNRLFIYQMGDLDVLCGLQDEYQKVIGDIPKGILGEIFR